MVLINRRHESVNSNWGHARSLSVLMYWVLPEFALESQARSRQPYARLQWRPEQGCQKLNRYTGQML